ncbi:hypothetical protein [Aestuariirhabdus litorea]|uniref:Uncharacterized protein n=1 Tax=Aestuariirhabdus litorea TaxID=2528527 RepID=A0A3P3VRP7_9GAMM|nr:hypothetical protein [Aestuariirhabdus litorea]RRJ84658.1 hypothetical protein D0544_06025 [Aestuariirhabdus litorea]RWW97882.1 hypothetical protein DZC74_06020 [Endozoicomonadaceae bacterium GTF-13]
MPASYLEIVELPTGEIVLQRSDDEEPLVTIDFSEEAKLFLQEGHVEVAKAMINAGIAVVGSMAENPSAMEAPRTVH